MTRSLPAALLLCIVILSACQSNTSPAIDATAANPPASEQSNASNTDIDQGTAPSPNEDVETGQSETADNTNATPPADNTGKPFSTTSPKSTGNVQHPELTEISGLALSTRVVNTLWAINDSGNQAKLYALTHTGESIGSWPVNATNNDWEDLASAWINGESYLFIADIGNNNKRADEHLIHVISEPLLDGNTGTTLNSLHTIRFSYPDGNYNSESLSVADGWIYILTKEAMRDNKRQASRVYRLPLQLSGPDETITAEYISSLDIPPSSVEASLIASLSGVDVSQPTAFDIDQQNRHAYVLTYRSVYRYTRQDNQSWADTFSQTRHPVHTHSLSQAEALAVASNGVVWFTTEKRPAPLWALPAAD